MVWSGPGPRLPTVVRLSPLTYKAVSESGGRHATRRSDAAPQLRPEHQREAEHQPGNPRRRDHDEQLGPANERMTSRSARPRWRQRPRHGAEGDPDPAVELVADHPPAARGVKHGPGRCRPTSAAPTLRRPGLPATGPNPFAMRNQVTPAGEPRKRFSRRRIKRGGCRPRPGRRGSIDGKGTVCPWGGPEPGLQQHGDDLLRRRGTGPRRAGSGRRSRACDRSAPGGCRCGSGTVALAPAPLERQADAGRGDVARLSPDHRVASPGPFAIEVNGRPVRGCGATARRDSPTGRTGGRLLITWNSDRPTGAAGSCILSSAISARAGLSRLAT